MECAADVVTLRFIQKVYVMPVIEITSLEHPGVEVFSTLTEAQLRNRIDPQRASLSPKARK